MPLPVLPPDYCALVPNPSEPLCDVMRKVLLEKSQADCNNLSWMFTAEGAVSTEFATAICTALGLIDCAGGGTTETTTAGTGTTTASTTTPATALAWAVTGPPGGVGSTPNRFIEIDLATGNVTVISTASSFFYGLAEDPTNGTLYGLVLNGSDIDLVTVNKVTGAESVVAAAVSGFTATPNGMTFKSDGTLYVSMGNQPSACATNGTLFTMNKTTGVLSSVGTQTGVFVSDICFGPSGILYGLGQLGCFSEKRLISFNLSTGAATVVNVLDPNEAVPGLAYDSMAYINGLMWKTLLNQISIFNVATGDVTDITTFDMATQGRIRGLAKGQ